MNKVGCRALILSPGFKGTDYLASLRALAPELDGAAPGRLKAVRLPELEIVIRLGADKTAGALNFADVAAPASKGRLAELAAFGENAAIRRPHQHPIHQRHDGCAQRRDADPSQYSQQRLFHRRGDAADRRRPPLHSRALLSLLRHGAGQSCLRHAWRLHGVALRGVRAARRAAGRSRRSAAPACMAFRPCSSPCSAIQNSSAST